MSSLLRLLTAMPMHDRNATRGNDISDALQIIFKQALNKASNKLMVMKHFAADLMTYLEQKGERRMPEAREMHTLQV